MSDQDQMPRRPTMTDAARKPTLFGRTVARLDSRGDFWLMDKPAEGWESTGYRYRLIQQLAADWAIRFVGIGADEHSRYYVVEPL